MPLVAHIWYAVAHILYLDFGLHYFVWSHVGPNIVSVLIEVFCQKTPRLIAILLVDHVTCLVVWSVKHLAIFQIGLIIYLKKKIIGQLFNQLIVWGHIIFRPASVSDRWKFERALVPILTHAHTHTHTTTHGLHTDRSKSTDSRIYTSRTKLTLKRIFPQETENAQWWKTRQLVH